MKTSEVIGTKTPLDRDKRFTERSKQWDCVFWDCRVTATVISCTKSDNMDLGMDNGGIDDGGMGIGKEREEENPLTGWIKPI